MSSTSATPTVDALRHRGVWGPAMDKFVQWDPEWIERCARMTNNPWATGILPVKWIELICIALNAACTHLNEGGVRRHIRAALDAGATGEEIRETFKGVSVLGIHSVAITLPILFEEAKEAGVQPAPRPASAVHTPVVDQFKATGRFNPDWEAIYRLDPEWLEQFLAMGADLYGGVLEPKLVELMAVAVDASCTHLYTPGIRRHVHGAFAQGATIEEIMDVLKLCGSLGVDALEIGAPILAEELTEHQQRG
jgi:alkylhydroperoxidase/carboxymuconolactone decarboxylase family protein YurZ